MRSILTLLDPLLFGGLLGAMLAIATATEAQAVPIGFYRVDKITTQQGLRTDSLLSVSRLSDGRIAFTGLRGEPLVFDGFRISSLPCGKQSAITLDGASDLTQTPDGSIWLSSDKGILLCRNGELHRLDPEPNIDGNDLSYQQARQAVWIATSRGLYEFPLAQPERHQRLSPDLSVVSAAPDRRGNIYLGTARGLSVGKAFESFAPVAHAQLAKAHIWTVQRDSAGRVLVGTRGLGLAIIADEKIELIGRAQGLQNDIVRGIAEVDGAIWLGTAGGGVTKLEDGRVETLTSADGLASNTVTSLLADELGVVWATTAGGGLNRIWPSAFAQFKEMPERQRIGFTFGILPAADGSLWVGSNQGLARAHDGQLEMIGVPGAGQGASVTGVLRESDATLLLATRLGVYRFGVASESFEVIPELASLRDPILLRDDDGYWIGEPTAISHFQNGKLRKLHALSRGYNTLMLHHDAALGALLATPRGAFQIEEKKLVPLGPEDRWASGFYRMGTRLFITGTGLYFIDRDKAGAIDLGPLAAASADNASRTYRMQESHGSIWLTSRGGLMRLNKRELLEVEPNGRVSIEILGPREGLSASVFEESMQDMIKVDGGMVLASSSGVFRFDPSLLTRTPERVRLTVSELENEQQVFEPSKALVLPQGSRRVAIKFGALPASHSASVHLSYRLLPIEREFRSDGGTRQAVYGGLQPQLRYRFELRGEIPGSTLAASSQFDLEIAPRFMERFSVRIGLPLALLAVMLGLLGFHIRSLRRQRRLLLQEVAQQTAELERLVRTDSLTSLANRRSFDAALSSALRRDAGSTGLLLIDIDFFKLFNDSAGHQAGDECLKKVARTIVDAASSFEPGPMVARFGGEEFAVITRYHPERLEALANALKSAVEAIAMPHPGFADRTLSISIGGAIGCAQESAQSLIERADAALYRAKRDGRDCVRFAG